MNSPLVLKWTRLSWKISSYLFFFLFYIQHKLIYVTTVIYFALEKVSRQKQTENESSNRDSELLFAVRFGILMDRNLLKDSIFMWRCRCAAKKRSTFASSIWSYWVLKLRNSKNKCTAVLKNNTWWVPSALFISFFRYKF